MWPLFKKRMCTSFVTSLVTITQKLKFGDMIFHLIQHITHLLCKYGHFWGGGGGGVAGLHILLCDRATHRFPACVWYKHQGIILRELTYLAMVILMQKDFFVCFYILTTWEPPHILTTYNTILSYGAILCDLRDVIVWSMNEKKMSLGY